MRHICLLHQHFRDDIDTDAFEQGAFLTASTSHEIPSIDDHLDPRLGMMRVSEVFVMIA